MHLVFDLFGNEPNIQCCEFQNELAIVRARNAQLDGALEAQEEELTAQQAQIELLLNPGATQLVFPSAQSAGFSIIIILIQNFEEL